jgi:cyclophilin family peptidyl-prolyl cis-trans isomerase
MHIIKVIRRQSLRFGALLGMTVTAVTLANGPANATVVRMETTLGPVEIELYDADAPLTVANFLRYAGAHLYDGTLIHRSEPGFVVQGGGFSYGSAPPATYPPHVPELPPVKNEFSPLRSNVRGTIAMAKTAGDPDSATSEWFFNLADNAANLDNQNGGFTVFGRVLDDGMQAIVDPIAALPRVNLVSPFFPISVAFDTLPVYNIDEATAATLNIAQLAENGNLVLVNRIPNVAAVVTVAGQIMPFVADSDMTFLDAAGADPASAATLLASFPFAGHGTALLDYGISAFTVEGVGAVLSRTIEMWYGGATRPGTYYAYGRTAGNPVEHWYEFGFDGTTGAEITDTVIKLHFVDGQRGDQDLTANGMIVHSGAPVTFEGSGSNSVSDTGFGCTLSVRPMRASRAGDWMLLLLFLAASTALRVVRTGRCAKLALLA